MATVAKTGGRKKPARGATRPRAASVSLRASRVSKWGNSLGVRIPQEAAERLKLRAGERVSFEVGEDSITIRVARRKWTEAELLKGVTPDMVGGEVDWGPAVGKEAW